jgi:uncharacterized protein
MYKGPVIDVDVHHQYASELDIIARLPAEWRDYVMGPRGDRPVSIVPAPVWPLAGGTSRDESYPEDGRPPGSDYDLLRRQLLEKYNVERAILNFNVGQEAGLRNPLFAHAVVRAVNDWNVETWLEIDDNRLFSGVLIPSQLPEQGAGEIRRIGGHPKIVQALLAYNGLGKPFGHPLYDPIFEAAQEMDLPVAMHGGGALGLPGQLQPVAGGRPPTRLEFHGFHTMHGGMHQLASLLMYGTFDKFPRLKFVCVEVGVAWVPWLIWNLDAHYDVLRRETGIKKLPSEYFREHVTFSTQPLEESPDPRQLMDLLESFGGMEDILMFATDYPHWDADTPAFISRRLPDAWQDKLYYANALKTFRWPSQVVAVPAGDGPRQGGNAQG